ncbi:acyltransferase family-domain-containing protein [Xylariomycetidae sp. FL0641]|nr:acyltransferase family-domain-containing protein [Xylariomycetidae sp. FL0641]
MSRSEPDTADYAGSKPPTPSTLAVNSRVHDVLHETAYLDGVRGLASLLVYIHHQELWAHDSQYSTIERAFGYRGRHHLITLPLVRLLFNGGHFSTAVFFVLSGYTLSIRGLDLVESDARAKLADHLASAVFRRWLRLYIPVLVTTFVCMTAWHVLPLRVPGLDQQQPTWTQEFWVWGREVSDFSFPFRSVASPAQYLRYNDHLWSIPAEFRGSMVVFATLLAVSKFPWRRRMACYGVLVAYFLFAVADGWDLAFFVAGMATRDLHLALGRRERAQPHRQHVVAERPDGKQPTVSSWRALPYLGLLASLYLGGVPTCVSAKCFRMNPGWALFAPASRLVSGDPKWLYLLPAASLFVACVGLTRLRRLFESKACQYLGKISYGLYLVHGPAMRTLANPIYAAIGWPGSPVNGGAQSLGSQLPLAARGPLGLEVGFLAAQAVMLPVVLWLAQVVAVALDRPSTRLSRDILRRLQGGA